jgi:hypothetical protein
MLSLWYFKKCVCVRGHRYWCAVNPEPIFIYRAAYVTGTNLLFFFFLLVLHLTFAELLHCSVTIPIILFFFVLFCELLFESIVCSDEQEFIIWDHKFYGLGKLSPPPASKLRTIQPVAALYFVKMRKVCSHRGLNPYPANV